MKKINKKIIFLILIFLVCTAIFMVVILKVKQANLNINKKLIKNNTIEISEIALEKIIEDEYGSLFYIDNQTKKRVVQNNNTLSRLQFSPLKDKYGFTENLDNDQHDKPILIFTGDINHKETKEIYRGSFKTSGWEWFSNEEILVFTGCGTECEVLHLIDLVSGEKIELNYGVNYKWSPDKTKVLALHYTIPGFTVGDKFGNELFTLERKFLEYSKLFDFIQAEWSEDGGKIALVIKKDNEEKMELLVFDVQNDFNIISQSDIEAIDDIDLSWNNNKVLIDDKEYIIK